jgi:E3 SUMO-protein ligase PIAS1
MQGFGVPLIFLGPPAGSMYTLQDWRDNPLWKPVRALSNMETLPGEYAPFCVCGSADPVDISANENSHTRRERKVHFTLPTEVVEKLSASKCVSHIFRPLPA